MELPNSYGKKIWQKDVRDCPTQRRLELTISTLLIPGSKLFFEESLPEPRIEPGTPGYYSA